MYGYYHKNENINPSKWNIAGVVLFIGCFYGYKILCNRFDFLIPLQFLIMLAFLFGMLYNFRKVAILATNIKIHKNIQKIIIQISNLTLDIYIIQMILINQLMPKISFPLNIFIVFVLILIVAFINNRLAMRFSSLLNSYLAK